MGVLLEDLLLGRLGLGVALFLRLVRGVLRLQLVGALVELGALRVQLLGLGVELGRFFLKLLLARKPITILC